MWTWFKETMTALKAEMPKTMLNEASNAVKDALTGLVLCNKGLVLLEGQPIIMRRDHNELQGKVKIISGCGAGHEPSFSGFVGPGMLTAAIVDDVYTAPPSSVILQAIRELGREHSEGILLLAINYPGIRINFTLAMERAQNEGIYVKMLVVGDDCSFKCVNKQKESRGLAGIILISKIAGAMAEEGKRLDQVYETCSALAASDITTISVGLISSPRATQRCVSINYVQLGIGLHGEHSIEKFPFTSTKEVVKKMFLFLMQSRSEYVAAEQASPIVLLLNNMGNSSKLEEQIFAMEVLKQLAEMNYTIARIYCGSFLTSLEVPGFSVTLLTARKPEVLRYLDAPVSVPGWPQHFQCEYVTIPNGFSLPHEHLLSSVASKWDTEDMENSGSKLCIGPKMAPKSAQSTLQVIGLAADTISVCERQLNMFDCEAGDGEAGTVLKRAALAIKNAIKTERIIGDRPFAILQVVSELCENTMGGIYGALYSIFFAAAAKTFQSRAEDYPIDAFLWLEALKEGNRAIMNYAYMTDDDRTLLVSLHAAANALENSLKEYPDEQVDALKNAAKAAEDQAQKTVCKGLHKCPAYSECPLMPEPGAHAVGIWIRALYEGCRLKF